MILLACLSIMEPGRAYTWHSKGLHPTIYLAFNSRNWLSSALVHLSVIAASDMSLLREFGYHGSIAAFYAENVRAFIGSPMSPAIIPASQPAGC